MERKISLRELTVNFLFGMLNVLFMAVGFATGIVIGNYMTSKMIYFLYNILFVGTSTAYAIAYAVGVLLLAGLFSLMLIRRFMLNWQNNILVIVTKPIVLLKYAPKLILFGFFLGLLVHEFEYIYFVLATR